MKQIDEHGENGPNSIPRPVGTSSGPHSLALAEPWQKKPFGLSAAG
jgi:hypothetical protein